MTDERTIDRRLDDLLQTQELVRSIVASMLHVGPEAVDCAVNEGLQRLGDHLGVDRTYVFFWNGDGTFSNTHEWCAPGIPAEIDNLQNVPEDIFAGWMPVLRAGEHIAVPDVPGLPDERAEEREHLEVQGIKSLMVVPIVSLGRLFGMVGFDSCAQFREFSEGETNLLRSIADGIGAVLLQRRADQEARHAEARLAALTRNATDFVLVVGEEGDTITYASPSWARLGLDLDAVIGSPWSEWVHPDDAMSIEAMFGLMTEQTHRTVAPLPDFRARVGDGTEIWLAGTISDLRDDPAVAGIVVNAHDITRRKHTEAQLAHDAMHDPLTGLANRSLFMDRLHSACRRAAETDGMVGILFLDLDSFKFVNDTYGHAIGDRLLKIAASRLSACAGSNDTLARFGGDEFVFIVESARDAVGLEAFAQRLQETLASPFIVGGGRFRVTASVGVAVGSGERLDPDRLLADADTAMYKAKREGRNRVATFDARLRVDVVRATSVMQRLPGAIESGAIEVFYQPLVDLETGRTLGAEALARWTDPELGAISPAEFVPLAEDSGLIAALTEAVFDRALTDAADWPDDVYVSLNLSAGQLASPGTAEELVAMVRTSGIDPRRVCVEVTETSVMHQPIMAAATLQWLRRMGVRVALDDFGTGHSSLAVLREMPIDVIKIDRAFVRGVATRESDRRLVDAVVSIASGFDMTTLGEGVETDEQRLALLAAGCLHGQGFLYSPAVPVGEFATRLHASVDS